MEKETYDDIIDLLRNSGAEEEGKKNLPDNALLKGVKDNLAIEQVAYRGVMEQGGPISVLHEVQRRLSQALQKVGASGDLETILLAESLIVDNERVHYADTPAMESSLDNALFEIEVALELVGKVQDPEAYRTVDDSHRLPRNRIGGLPKDEARQFFKSHRSRLENLEKARLMGIDKELIVARKKNLGGARASYIELQENALANPDPEHENENNFDGPR